MAQFGKASARRSKPSYFMAILGVTIVLFFVGIFGWLLLNARTYTIKLKEEVEVQVYLRNSATGDDIDSLRSYITSKPYTKVVQYIDKDMAKQAYLETGGNDFSGIIEGNPLPASVEFNLKGVYVHQDTMAAIKTDLESRFPTTLESVNYPAALVEKMGPTIQWVLIVLVSLAVIFSLLSIVLIDNTIRLAMYSNRFLIKTMQMVGATRGFISRPMTWRAVINGSVAALLAIGLIYGLVLLFEDFLPELKTLRNNQQLLMLFGFMMVLGIVISLISTYLSVRKYLKMKLDELY